MMSKTLSYMPKTEAELRQAVIDRLIAASLSSGKSAREAALLRWRELATADLEQRLS